MEQPRPQPKASHTLFYFLIFATSAQIIGDWLSPSPSQDTSDGSQEAAPMADDVSSSWASLGLALRWAPHNSDAFLPQLFRSRPPAEEVMIVEEVNDDLLISSLAESAPQGAKEGELSETQEAHGVSGRFRMGDVEIEDYRDDDHVASATGKAGTDQGGHERRDSGEALVSGSKDAPQSLSVQQSKTPSSETEKMISHQVETRLQEPTSKKTPEDSSKAQASTSEQSSPQAEITSSSKQPLPSSDRRLASRTQKKVQTPHAKMHGDQSDSKKRPPQRRRATPKRRKSASGVTLYSIEDSRGALRKFYKKLEQVKSGKGKVHIVHYGDSLIAGDYVTRTVRRLLQKTFGDGGHGFFLAGKGSRWYGRRWVELKSYGKWTKNKITRPRIKDRLYGLGGVSFRTSRKGAWVQARATGRRLGGIVDRFELFYLAQPEGGVFKVSFAGQTQEVSTLSERAEVKRLVMLAKRRGAHSARVKVVGDGEVRLFGFVFERNRAGVVYDALGLEGVRARLLLNIEYASWLTQLKQRQPDLYILHYGTNESEKVDLKLGAYKKQLHQVVRRFKRALPSTPCLLMSPMDRAKKNPETGRLKSMAVVESIVTAQREVAAESGCAFWSAYDAMGGRGSMARWYRSSPKLAGGDLTHPTGMGANRLGAMFFAALMEGYRKTHGGK